eukprot:m51a1_g13844 hypothetical protein (498) ;mRNA; f:530675-532791
MSDARLTRDREYLACKARLADLFAQIDKEFDSLWDENQSLRMRLGMEPLKDQPRSKFKLKKLTTRNDKKGKESEDRWAHSKSFTGHRDGVWETTTCPWDNALFATASVDRTARLWSAETGQCVFAYFGHKGSVNSVRFRPDQRLVLTASGDRSIHVSRVAPDAALLRHPSVSSAAGGARSSLTHSGTVAGAKPVVRPWAPVLVDGQSAAARPDGGQSHANSDTESPAGPPSPAQGLAGPAGMTASPLVLQSQAPVEHVDDIELVDGAPAAAPTPTVFVRSPVQEYKGHNGVVIAADWVGADKVVSASWDKTVRLWSVNGAEIVQIPIGGAERMHLSNVTVHPTAPVVVCSSSDGSFRVWDTRISPNPHSNVETVVCHDSCLTAVFSKDGDSIISSGADRFIKVWDPRNFKSPKEAVKGSTPLGRLWLSPVNHLFVVPQDGDSLHVYDLTGHRRGKMKAERSDHQEDAPFTCASWASNETMLYTGNFEGKVTAWRAAW